jgi:L-ascorbate metabolism protein UlaG (beta-lactamase superfamily)
MNTNKPWYKSGQELLDEIRASVPLFEALSPKGALLPGGLSPGTVLLWFFGQHGFAVKMGGKVIDIDVILNDFPGSDGKNLRLYPVPFPPSSPMAIDYYFCTHNHIDHLNLETILPLAQANPQAVFIVPRPLCSILTNAGIDHSRVIGAREGEILELPGTILVNPVAAAHPEYEQNGDGDYACLGYIIRGGGVSVYHAGDTFASPRLADALKKNGPIDIAILPINGGDWERTASDIIGNMSAIDAVKLGRAISADLLIPSHYDMISGNTEAPALFARYMYELCPERKYHIFAPGERFVYVKG